MQGLGKRRNARGARIKTWLLSTTSLFAQRVFSSVSRRGLQESSVLHFPLDAAAWSATRQETASRERDVGSPGTAQRWAWHKFLSSKNCAQVLQSSPRASDSLPLCSLQTPLFGQVQLSDSPAVSPLLEPLHPQSLGVTRHAASRAAPVPFCQLARWWRAETAPGGSFRGRSLNSNANEIQNFLFHLQIK